MNLEEKRAVLEAMGWKFITDTNLVYPFYSIDPGGSPRECDSYLDGLIVATWFYNERIQNEQA
jgi:hypothetical protein